MVGISSSHGAAVSIYACSIEYSYHKTYLTGLFRGRAWMAVTAANLAITQ